MYRVKKTMEISAAHSLSFKAAGVSEAMHGHNWKITVYCLLDSLDHRNLNEVLPCNPSTENLARWICEHVDKCYRVDVEEYPGAEASYERP